MKSKKPTIKRKPIQARTRPKAKRLPKVPQPSMRATKPSVAHDRLLQLSRAVEQSPVSIVITNLQGNIEYVNPKFSQVTGYTFAEVIGKNPRFLKSGETNQDEYRQMWETILSGQEWHGEFHNKKKNGELYWEAASLSPIIDAGKITHFLAVKEDITDRKRMEAALRASEQYARSIVQSSLDIIIAVDNHRRIIEFNPAAEHAFGYSREQVIGKHIGFLYADGKQSQIVHQTVFREGTVVQEVWNRRKNGEIFPSYLSAAVMRNEQNELVGIVGVSRDITANKLAQEMLARRDATLAAVAFAAERFLRASSWEKSLPNVLERIGLATNVSRVYLFENKYDESQTLFWRLRGEWVASNIASQIDNPEFNNFSVKAAGLGRWREILEKGQLLQCHVQDLPKAEQQLLVKQDVKSLVIVPIFAKQIWWGIIGFDDCCVEREWSVQEVDALVTAANTLGGAIERERADQELKTRVRHLGLLNEITRASMTLPDLHQMLQYIADRFGGLFDADRCFISLWDEHHKRTIPAAASSHFQNAYVSSVITSGEPTLTELALAEGQPLVFEDISNTPYATHPIIQQFPTKSVLGLPMTESGRKLGAVLLSFDQRHRFSQSEIDLATQAADQIALAIIKTQSFAAEQQRAAELEALRQASLSLTSSLDLPAVLDAILESTMVLTPGARDAHIYLYNQGKLTFGSSHWKDGRKGLEWSPPRENGLTYTVARTGETMVIPDMRNHPLFLGAPSSWQGAIVGLPLKIADRVVGVMSIAFEESHTFIENELRVLRLLATQAAIAIENARLYDQVQQLAVTDPLTGMFNRRGFYQIGAIEFDRAWRFDRPLSAILLDIDHFKQINDMYSHAVGDKVLVALADACRHSLRTVDIVGRYGGEEFVILLPEADAEVALRVAERLRTAVEEIRVPTNGEEARLTISVGVATMTPETPDLNILIEHADQAQYRAKEAGRNHVIIFDKNKSIS